MHSDLARISPSVAASASGVAPRSPAPPVATAAPAATVLLMKSRRDSSPWSCLSFAIEISLRFGIRAESDNAFSGRFIPTIAFAPRNEDYYRYRHCQAATIDGPAMA